MAVSEYGTGNTNVSVVVCTLNRCEKLRRCVDALLLIKTDYSWELIIVDNGSSDHTPGYLEALQRQEVVPRLKVILHGERGNGSARNAGWRAAQGDIIGFTDDDCYLTPNYIDATVAAFKRDVDFVGGQVLLYDREDLPATITSRDTYLRFEPYSYIPSGEIHGANMIFRRAVLDQIGGFDSLFGAGAKFSGDDVDALGRASWAGFVGAFDPSIIVYHHHGRKTIDEVRRLGHWYDRGCGAYHAKFILKQASRVTYLDNYARRLYWGLRCADTRRIMVGRTAREIIGGARYIRVKINSIKVRSPSASPEKR